MFCQKVLLAYDGTEGSQHAFEKVIALAKLNPTLSVHLLYVNQPPQAMVGVGEAYVISPESLEVKLDPETERKITLATDLLSGVADCSSDIVVHESPGRKIIEQAEQNDCDLIVIGSRGLGGFKKLILGSISSFVVNHSTIPVLVVK